MGRGSRKGFNYISDDTSLTAFYSRCPSARLLVAILTLYVWLFIGRLFAPSSSTRFVALFISPDEE
jgi:hypothetical protein